MDAADVESVVSLGLSLKELQFQEKENIWYSSENILGFLSNPDSICLVAEVDGQFAGFRLSTFNPYVKEAYLSDIAVVESFRRLGVAKALYRETFKILKEKDCVWVWTLVKSKNEKMAKMLVSEGFEKGVNYDVYFKSM